MGSADPFFMPAAGFCTGQYIVSSALIDSGLRIERSGILWNLKIRPLRMPVDIGRVMTDFVKRDEAAELSCFLILLEHLFKGGMIFTDVGFKLVCRIHFDRAERTDHVAEGTLMAVITLIPPVSEYLGIL